MDPHFSPWPAREGTWRAVGADCVCAASLRCMDLDVSLYKYIYVCVPVCLQGIHALPLDSWDLWCGSVAVSALPGCWIWSFPSNIFNPLKMQMCHMQQIQGSQYSESDFGGLERLLYHNALFDKLCQPDLRKRRRKGGTFGQSCQADGQGSFSFQLNDPKHNCREQFMVQRER